MSERKDIEKILKSRRLAFLGHMQEEKNPKKAMSISW